MITGQLHESEKNQLMDLLEREKMGFRAIDLESQFELGKILLPRISEYAAVLIVSLLRGTQANIRVGRSDEIYASLDTQDEASVQMQRPQSSSISISPEKLSISTSTTSNYPHVIGVVQASATLTTHSVEATESDEYQRLVEALNQEIRMKAAVRGAQAIIAYSVELIRLSLPSQYRIQVLGTAVRHTESK